MKSLKFLIKVGVELITEQWWSGSSKVGPKIEANLDGRWGTEKGTWHANTGEGQLFEEFW